VLKDKINENFEKISKEKETQNKDDKMGIEFKGELEIWAIEGGKVVHHDKGSNVVTKWAKHATMHMLTSESYSTHGDRTFTNEAIQSTATAYTKRQLGTSHVAGIDGVGQNDDGTLISDKAYLSDNDSYFWTRDGVVGATDNYGYWTVPHPDVDPDTGVGDEGTDPSDFMYPFFPTKMLFGTGIEYSSWAEIQAAGRDGIDLGGYGNIGNGGWINSDAFEENLSNPYTPSNYYSASWNGTDYELNHTRTLNDVYSAPLDTVLSDEAFAIKGAIKDGTYNGQNGIEVLKTVDGNLFLDGSYRGIGRPAFIYAKRNARWMEPGESILELGETTETKDIESKITYTVVMPEQPEGEFYPYNGYTLKVAGLYADASMLLGNTVPLNNADNDDDLEQEYINYKQQCGGILWATRNISPISKGHNTTIIAQWTIYL
jgi:hypothetical protein